MRIGSISGILITGGPEERQIFASLALAQSLAGVEGQEMELLILPHAKTFIERIADAADAKAPAIGAELLPVLRSMPELRPHLQKIAGLLQLRNEKVWLISPFAVEIK